MITKPIPHDPHPRLLRAIYPIVAACPHCGHTGWLGMTIKGGRSEAARARRRCLRCFEARWDEPIAWEMIKPGKNRSEIILNHRVIFNNPDKDSTAQASLIKLPA